MPSEQIMIGLWFLAVLFFLIGHACGSVRDMLNRRRIAELQREVKRATQPDPDRLRSVARLIARELPATINGRTGNSPAHRRMHEVYSVLKRRNDFETSAERARALWIEEALFRELSQGEEPCKQPTSK